MKVVAMTQFKIPNMTPLQAESPIEIGLSGILHNEIKLS